jgi:hypothetical protein
MGSPLYRALARSSVTNTDALVDLVINGISVAVGTESGRRTR